MAAENKAMKELVLKLRQQLTRYPSDFPFGCGFAGF
jgi:hypothetical protein